ncbi:MerR family transcriptional regulator [Streptomyces sp. KS_5]|uniref:MerR family transcriptional regulator n=1 Tax=Streptomyces sp. KS_5 TaxID=1881018 RepID=UPI00089B6BEE|nr:MerR family transcriptional regulator [Streptomyces sp. KS_5]SEC29298.1 DNA-binding transcriptional regulator, MerR family [Streptomyces sp. KS_5]
MLRHPGGGHPPDPPHDGTGLFTIGEPARATGLTVRTIRYWSDEGVLHPVTRSSGGCRLYDAESVARLELIRTLPELGLGLDDVRKVVSGEEDVASVAATHVAALDAQILPQRGHPHLKVTRAVLSTVARRGSATEEMTFSRKLVHLAAEALGRGVEPGSPEAGRILLDLIGDADPAMVLERLRSSVSDEVARYRELLSVVKGRGPESAYRAEFARVVAALEACVGG